MKQAWNKTKHFVAALIYIIGIMVFVTLFDLVVAVLGGRFYSDATFVALFRVSGVFAAFSVMVPGWIQPRQQTKFHVEALDCYSPLQAYC